MEMTAQEKLTQIQLLQVPVSKHNSKTKSITDISYYVGLSSLWTSSLLLSRFEQDDKTLEQYSRSGRHSTTKNKK